MRCLAVCGQSVEVSVSLEDRFTLGVFFRQSYAVVELRYEGMHGSGHCCADCLVGLHVPF